MTTLLLWTQLSPANNPASRTSTPTIATDSVRNKVFAFQGSACGIANHQSDSWNGSDWTNLGDVPTAADSASTVVWDVANSKTLILSSYTASQGFCDSALRICYGNHWYTYDGTTFTLLAPATVPSPRTQMVGSYSPALGKVVLFGGYNSGDPTGCLGCGQPQSPTPTYTMFPETWLWDGTTFTQLVTATSPVYLEVAATLGSNVYAWGAPFTGSYPTERSATLWKFDGTDWSIVTTAHTPPARSWPAFAYWPSYGKIVMHGGGNANLGGTPLSDTWSFDGTDWTQESPCGGGPARAAPNASYDPVNGWYLMAGGQSTSVCSYSTANQTWKLEALTAPTVNAVSVSNNNCSTAILHVGATPNGFTTDVYFDYGTTSSYGSSVFALTLPPGGSNVPVPATISGLSPGVTYHYRARLVPTGGCSIVGVDNTFVEGDCASGKAVLNTRFDLG